MVIMRSASADAPAGPIDMSLRLWSEDFALRPLVEDFGAKLGVVQVRGESTGHGRRIARRHYASLAACRGRGKSDVEAWMVPLIAKIRAHRQLETLIKSGGVEAVFWVALLRDEDRSTPDIEQLLVDEVAELGAAVFVEDYVHLTNGNPTKRWLPAEPRKVVTTA